MTIDPVGRGQSESPVGNTVHNLVHTLSVKLDSAHRYGLYQEDAVREGHEDCAEVFADIAEQERDMIDRLVHCLQDRLGGASTEVGAAPGGGVTGGELGYETIPEAGVQEVPPVPEDTELGLSPDALEAGAEPDVPPTAPGGPGAEPDVPPTAPGGPGTEPDVPPTAPGGPGAEPRGPDAPRTP